MDSAPDYSKFGVGVFSASWRFLDTYLGGNFRIGRYPRWLRRTIILTYPVAWLAYYLLRPFAYIGLIVMTVPLLLISTVMVIISKTCRGYGSLGKYWNDDYKDPFL